MISSINIGSHVVDTLPLSTLGAICIACAGEHENRQKLFRNLLIWACPCPSPGHSPACSSSVFLAGSSDLSKTSKLQSGRLELLVERGLNCANA
jgi:hypothetical protein